MIVVSPDSRDLKFEGTLPKGAQTFYVQWQRGDGPWQPSVGSGAALSLVDALAALLSGPWRNRAYRLISATHPSDWPPEARVTPSPKVASKKKSSSTTGTTRKSSKTSKRKSTKSRRKKK